MDGTVLREALVAARRPMLTAAALTCTVLLALFPLLWGVGGLPTARGLSIYDQQFHLEWVLLALLVPWTAARVAAEERQDALVLFSAIAATRPSRILIARWTAMFAASALLVCASFPAVLVAREMSNIPAWRLLVDQLSMLAFTGAASGVTMCWMQTAHDRLSAWLLSALTTLVVLAVTRMVLPTMAQAAFVFAAAGAAVVSMVAANADRARRYLSERAA
jgi:hypothetical protein